MVVTQAARRRRAAATVEMAVVVSVGLLFLFGIFEYGRLVMARQLIDDAAREGARFAVVNTDDPTLVADTQQRVQAVLAGASNQYQNVTIQVFEADANGNNIGPAANAGFGQYIAVRIDGDYTPVLPSFLFMGQTLHLRSVSMMYSEAN